MGYFEFIGIGTYPIIGCCAYLCFHNSFLFDFFLEYGIHIFSFGTSFICRFIVSLFKDDEKTIGHKRNRSYWRHS
jgi:hypothetical protein